MVDINGVGQTKRRHLVWRANSLPEKSGDDVPFSPRYPKFSPGRENTGELGKDGEFLPCFLREKMR